MAEIYSMSSKPISLYPNSGDGTPQVRRGFLDIRPLSILIIGVDVIEMLFYIGER